MELKQMEYFKVIVDSGSISEASRILHMSQPPLSMSMKKLEDELGVKLLIRGSRHVQLTEAGAMFYQRVSRILELTDSTITEVTRSGLYRTFSIGLTPSTIPIASTALADFVDKYTDVHFQIYDGSTFELMHLFETNVIDAAFLRTPFASGDFKSIPIKTEPMVAAIPKSIADSNPSINPGKSVSLQTLAQYPLSLYRRYHQLISDTFTKSNLSPNYFSICDDTRTSLLWADNGKAISIFPNSLMADSDRLVICPIKSADLETTILFVHKRENSTELINQFIPFLEPIRSL